MFKSKNHLISNFGLGGFSFFTTSILFIICFFNSSVLKAQMDATPSKIEGIDYFLPKIDLSHWKVTLPIPRAKDGKAQEVRPPEVLDYGSNEMIRPYMYNDSTDASIVFYATPGSTTANTKYSRSELREQMKPGSDKVNWTFADGGRLYGKLAVEEVSKNYDTDKYEYDRVIVMQIHGRLSDEQKILTGAKDNNAPPILKIYWIDGKIQVKTKECKNLKLSMGEILHKNAWGDDEGYTFSKIVGNKPYTLEVKVSDGRLEVILNNKQKAVYKGKHIEQWGIFENYFKAGNYLQSKNKNAFAKVKYYELEVSH